jgi:hypothetical protein
MKRIRDFRNFFNHPPKRRLQRLKSLSLSIAISKGGNSFEVAVKIYHYQQIIHQDFRVLCPADAMSECRAYWAGYELARAWTDLHTPNAKIFLADAAAAKKTHQRRLVA